MLLPARGERVTAYRTASAAWLAIAERAEAFGAGRGYSSGFYSGLCREIYELRCKNEITWLMHNEMRIALDDSFDVNGLSLGFFYWPQTKAGWHQRVIAATLLHCLALDEEEGR